MFLEIVSMFVWFVAKDFAIAGRRAARYARIPESGAHAHFGACLRDDEAIPNLTKCYSISTLGLSQRTCLLILSFNG